MNVLFDLDDTIHDKAASLRKCASRLFVEFGLDAKFDRIEFIQRFVAENVIIQPQTNVRVAETIWKPLEVLKPDSVDYPFDKFVDFPSIWSAMT
jgi:FMN phosphatase YigB (HAD superfamily)